MCVCLQFKGKLDRQDRTDEDTRDFSEYDAKEDMIEQCGEQGSDSQERSQSLTSSRASTSRSVQRSAAIKDSNMVPPLLTSQQSRNNLMVVPEQLQQHLEKPRNQHQEREQFTNWVGTVLQQLPQNLYRKASRNISNMLHDLLVEASTRQQQQ